MARWNMSFQALITLLFLFSGSVTAIRIVGMTVPEVVQNGTLSSVVLDCDYRYEKHESEGLVVKWFWNQDPEAVYQWIPGKSPEAIGFLKGRVNLTYRASSERYSEHRALQVLRPTTELTGNFTCKVSSFYDEKSASRRMIVYAPATYLNMTYSKPSAGSVLISCRAEGLYPKPEMNLYLGASSKTRVLVAETQVNISQMGEDGYNIHLQAQLEDRDLRQESLFHCLLFIPETEYQIQQEILYSPGYDVYGAYVGQGESTQHRIAHLLMMIAIICLTC